MSTTGPTAAAWNPSQPPSSRLDTPALPAPPPPFVAGTSRAVLTIMSGSDAGRVVALESAPLTIGRGPDVDVRIDDPVLSRRHARVARNADGSVYIEDLGLDQRHARPRSARHAGRAGAG